LISVPGTTLSAGGPGASSTLRVCGVSLVPSSRRTRKAAAAIHRTKKMLAFSRSLRAFHSNQLSFLNFLWKYKHIVEIKRVRNVTIPNPFVYKLNSIVFYKLEWIGAEAT